MSTHPNTILMCVFKPERGSRRTAREMAERADYDANDEQFKIGDRRYNLLVMEGDYDDGFQIRAEEGDIVVHDFMTYSYGEWISWTDLVDAQAKLEAWACVVDAGHDCTHEIRVGANYW